MAVDFNLPTVDTTYTAFPTQIIENIDAALQQLSVGSPSNVPTNAIKWDSSANRWKKYNGSAYVDLTGTYDLNADLSVNQLDLGDSERIRLGNSQDLQLYHNGSDSYVQDSGTGKLVLATNGTAINFFDTANSAFLAKFNTAGSVELYNAGSTKFETTSTGATITGNLIANGTEHKFSSGTSGDCQLIIEADTDNNNENDTPKILLRQDGGNDWSAVGTSGDNILELSNSVSFGGGISFKTGTTNGYTNATERMKIFGSGEVDIAAGLRILSGGDVGVGLTNPSNKLHIYSGTANALAVQSTVSGANILLVDNDTETKFQSVDGDLLIEADTQNNVAGSEIKLRIDGSQKWIIDASGNVTQTGHLTIAHGSTEAICHVKGFEGKDASVQLSADEGDNNGDRWKLISVASDNTFRLQNNITGANVTKWRIETDGDVIQTGNLTISNTQPFIQFDDTNNENDFQVGNAGGRFRVRDTDAAADRISVTTQGRIGINNTNPQAALHINGSGALGSIRLIDSSTSSGAPNLEIIGKRADSNNNTAFAANIYLGKNRTDAKVANNNILGTINFGGNHTNGNESNISYAASIRGVASDNFDSKSDMPTDLIFCTGAQGRNRSGESAGSSNSGTERLRIHSSGNVTLAGGQIKLPNASSSTPALAFSNNSNMGFYRYSSNQIGVSIGGVARYRFTPNFFGVDASQTSLDLGSSNARFDNIFLRSNPNVNSDKNLKNTIATSDLGLDFINKLNPVSYKYNGKTRTHYGLIAQEIEAVLGAISKPATDFAGFCKDEVDEDGNAITPTYGLRYSEFISPIIKAIQELSAKVAALEAA